MRSITVDDRVRHQRKGASFGEGKVLGLNPESGMALVEWDTHRVTRPSERFGPNRTHVRITNLTHLA